MEVRSAFVICPIGDPETETRQRSDQVYKHIIKPALSESGFEPVRADEISEPGTITSQVIERIMESPLVVADLSEHNPNVFYELALRHATGQPYIQLIRKGERIPFDVAGTRTILFDMTNPDSVVDARCEIGRQIQALENSDSPASNPVSISIDLKKFREKSTPESQTIVEVIDSINKLYDRLSYIDGKISNPESLLPIMYLRRAIDFSQSKIGSPSVESISGTTIQSLLDICAEIQKETQMDYTKSDIASDRYLMKLSDIAKKARRLSNIIYRIADDKSV